MLTLWNDLGFGGFDGGLLELERLRREMDRVFEGYERDYSPRRVVAPAPEWPRVQLHDTGEALRVTADLPGFAYKDVDLTVERQTLSLRGERKVSAPEGYVVYRQERESMRFARSFALPCRVDASKAMATLKDGVLEVMLPKLPEEQPRQIAVKVG